MEADGLRKACIAFLGNLFLHAPTVDAIAEYWMQNFMSLALDTGVDTPMDNGPIEMIVTMMKRTLRGCNDICIVGQGNLALSDDADAPRYMHTLNFLRPASGDFTMAIPVRYLLQERTAFILHSLVALFVQNAAVWKSAIRAATLGEHMLTYFHVGEDLGHWKDLYSPVLYAIEVFYRALRAPTTATQTEWLYSEDGGCLMVRRCMDVLRETRAHGAHTAAENEILGPYLRAVGALLGNSQETLVHRMGAIIRETREALYKMRKYATYAYSQLCRDYNTTYCLDDYNLLPWQEEAGSIEDRKERD